MISLIAAMLMWFEFWETSLLFIVDRVGTHPNGYMKFFMKRAIGTWRGLPRASASLCFPRQGLY